MARAGRVRTWVAEQVGKVYEALSGSAMGRAYVYDSDEASLGFRPLSERVHGSMRRDLDAMSQEQMLRVAHFLYTSNPLAEFLIDIPSAICLGSRVEFCLEIDHEKLKISKDEADALVERARSFLEPWWVHPSHDFAGKGLQYARTYLLTGEILILVTTVNEVTGLFQTDYVDSQLIASVSGLNRLSSVPGIVFIKAADSGGVPEPHIVSREGAFAGVDSAFFFRHAGRLNSMRGFSYLLTVSDWIDSYDQSFFGQVDRFILGNTLVHDIKQTGAQEADLKKTTATFRENASKPGGVFAHNEQVEHSIKTPNLIHSDSVEFLRQLRLHILGSKGIPEHWYGSGENSNRSTSESQNDVALKVIEALQDELAAIFRTLLHVGYDNLAMAQGFPPRSTGAVKIYPQLPKISEKDISQVGGVFAQTEAALDSAVAGERLSNATARKVTYAIVEKVTGVPVDEYAEEAAIESEAADREKKAAEVAKQTAQASADRLSKAAADQDAGNVAGAE